MLKKLLSETFAGAIIGVLAAIVAFLIAYNALIVQITAQKDDIRKLHKVALEDINRLHDKVVGIVAKVEEQKLLIERQLPLVESKYSALLSRVEELSNARLYFDKDVDMPLSDQDFQEAITFIRKPGPRSREEKQELYNIALKSTSGELRQEAFEAFLIGRDHEDWPATIELMLTTDLFVPSGHLESKNSLICDKLTRSFVLAKIINMLNSFYKNDASAAAEIPLITLRRRILELSAASCLQTKELIELIEFSRKHKDYATSDKLQLQLADYKTTYDLLDRKEREAEESNKSNRQMGRQKEGQGKE